MSLPNMRPRPSKSPDQSARDIIASQTVIKSKYSNIPVNVPVLYPSYLKTREGTMKCFNSQILREMIERDASFKQKGRYQQIKKNDPQDAIELIISDTKKLVSSTTAKKKKGSMFISELWGNKHLKDVIKVSRLDKAYETMQKAETEGLKEKLQKLEKAYERRDSQYDAADSAKILEEFMTKGLNSPELKSYRNSPVREIRCGSLNTSIVDLHDLEKTNIAEKKSGYRNRHTKPGSLEVSLNTTELLEKIYSPRSLHKFNVKSPSFNQVGQIIPEARSVNRRTTYDVPIRRNLRINSLSCLKDVTNELESSKSVKSSLTSIISFKTRSPKRLVPIIRVEESCKPQEQSGLRSPMVDTSSTKTGSVPSISEVFSAKQKICRPKAPIRPGLRLRAASIQNFMKNDM